MRAVIFAALLFCGCSSVQVRTSFKPNNFEKIEIAVDLAPNYATIGKVKDTTHERKAQ